MPDLGSQALCCVVHETDSGAAHCCLLSEELAYSPWALLLASLPSLVKCKYETSKSATIDIAKQLVHAQ